MFQENTVKKAKKDGKSDKSSDSSSNSDSDGNGKRKRKGKKGKDPNAKPFPEILNLTPAPADPSVPKTIDGVKYWWCLVLKKWCKHSPDQCKAKAKQTNSDKQSERKQTVRATMARSEESADEE